MLFFSAILGNFLNFPLFCASLFFILTLEKQHNKTLWERTLYKFRYLMHHRMNMKMGTLSGIVVGAIVFAINYKYGLFHSSLAFVKQFLFNFFMAAYNIKLIERLVSQIKEKWLAIFVGGFFPALIATLIVFLVHWLGQTPEPLRSTYWQGLFNLPLFTVIAWMYQSGQAHKKGFLRRFFLTKSSENIWG